MSDTAAFVYLAGAIEQVLGEIRQRFLRLLETIDGVV